MSNERVNTTHAETVEKLVVTWGLGGYICCILSWVDKLNNDQGRVSDACEKREEPAAGDSAALPSG